MSRLRFCILAGIVISALIFCAGCTTRQGETVQAKPTAAPLDTWKQVRLETTMGNITVALDPGMPVTSGNFETLVRQGFYNGVIFHRVMDGFMIQGGDPTGTGRGGPGYVIRDEFGTTNRNDRGTVAMANAGPDTGGSQFFINLVNNNYLDAKHPVFGRVIDGMDVADTIAKVQTSGQSGNFRPLRNVTILRAVLI
jgi:peptidylprolyl isomerase